MADSPSTWDQRWFEYRTWVEGQLQAMSKRITELATRIEELEAERGVQS